MILTRCTENWGNAALMHGDPPASTYYNVIYMPYSAGNRWGLYDQGGNIIEQSVDFRGPERELRNQVITPIGNHSPDAQIIAPCIYGGYINYHFGHFLVNTLSRLWPYYRRNVRLKIIFHGDAVTALSWPFARIILGALNIDWSIIESPKEPVLLKEVIVPSTSFIEQEAVYSIFGDLCRQIFHNLGIDTASVNTRDVAYVSKTKLSSGVGRFANEEVLEEQMRSAGVEILYPETLEFKEQLQRVIEHRTLIGTTGSFFHNTAFSPIPRHFVCLNPIPNINTNFVMIDKISNCNAEYFYPPEVKYKHGQDNFITQAEVSDMKAVAQQLLELAF